VVEIFYHASTPVLPCFYTRTGHHFRLTC
jgi:hypothetical protein